jgi:hypothetical protein
MLAHLPPGRLPGHPLRPPGAHAHGDARLPLPQVNNPDFSAIPEQHQKLTPPPPTPSPATQPPPPSATVPASPLPPLVAPAPPTPPPPQAPRPGDPARPGLPLSPEPQGAQQLQVQLSPPPAGAGAAASPGGVAPPQLDQSLFANLHAYVQISPALSAYEQRLQLRRIVPVAVDRAICEIITPVVERCAAPGPGPQPPDVLLCQRRCVPAARAHLPAAPAAALPPPPLPPHAPATRMHARTHKRTRPRAGR